MELWVEYKPSAEMTLLSLLVTPADHLTLHLPHELFLFQLQISSIQRNTFKIPPSPPLCLGKDLTLRISISFGVNVKSRE